MTKIKYIPKSHDNYNKPWVQFGAPNKDEYEKWSPVVCGICCLKMVGNTFGSTTNASLYRLTMECKQKGGFKELPAGEIQGVFHKPLLELAKNYRFDGRVERNLGINRIILSLQEKKFVILSVDKSKVNPNFKGSHLILVHTYNPSTKAFLVNDSDSILAKKGRDIKINSKDLEKISNRKGIIIWQKIV